MILYTPHYLGTLELKNRWIMLAMHTGYAADDGSFSERDFAFYGRRAAGGAAAITLVGGVNREACQDHMHRLDLPELEPGIRRVCDIIHSGDCKVIMHLFHAGRNNTAECLGGTLPPAPSPVASPIYRTVPREMTEEEILETIADYGKAAARCKACGVDGLEVSVSVGYLMTQFLSPLTNLRTDRWGGSWENRMRFPTEVLKEIRRAVGEKYPVIIKISGGDMLGGYELSHMIEFINQLPEGTIDGVTVTGGWHEAPVPQISYHVKPGGFSYLAEAVKEGTGLPVIACNRINSGEAAEEILQRGLVDFVGTARSFLADPDFAVKVQEGKSYNPCQGCNKGCIERVLKYKDVQCAFNPEAGCEYLHSSTVYDVPDGQYGSALIVGAGPVGLKTASGLLQAGWKVTVITDAEEAGGKLKAAAAPPNKQDLEKFRENLIRQVLKAGGEIRTGTEASAETMNDLIEELKPDHVYFAVGAEPIRLQLPGLEASGIRAVFAEDILTGKESAEGAKNIVIIGGGTVGLETAEYLGGEAAMEAGEEGAKITVIEMTEKAGKDLGGLKWIMMKALKKQGTAVKTGAAVKMAYKGGIMISEKKVVAAEAKEELQGDVISKLPCDLLIFAVGSRPRGALGLEQMMEQKNIKYTVLGDGNGAGNIMKGLKEAWEAVR